jgi:hypothetical protein
MWLAPTGHTLRGPFLDYWSRYGGLAQFGYPLTEEFTEFADQDPNRGRPVGLLAQYFERARFELHPKEIGSGYYVQFGTLAANFHAPALRAPAEYFPETGHNLSGAFKEYWHSHGGLFVNGYPITEPFRERNNGDGKEYLVQYFERSRFELHPENAGTPYEVLLGRLGAGMVDLLGYSAGAYPLPSHASDLSWVSGNLSQTPFYMSGCWSEVPNTLRGDYHISPIGPVAEAAGIFKGGDSKVGGRLVLFGHLASPEETPQIMCGYDAPPYIVERIQVNPVR